MELPWIIELYILGIACGLLFIELVILDNLNPNGSTNLMFMQKLKRLSRFKAKNRIESLEKATAVLKGEIIGIEQYIGCIVRYLLQRETAAVSNTELGLQWMLKENQKKLQELLNPVEEVHLHQEDNNA